MRGPQQHFRRSRREPQNLHKNLLIILLAWTIQGCQSTCPDLPHLPTTETVQSQANAATASANPRMTKLEDSRRFIRAHVDSRQQQEIRFMHHRCFHQIRCGHIDPE